jgi:hypothetical protein
MYMRAVTFRIVYVGVLSFAILLGAAFRHSPVQAAPAADSTLQTKSVASLPVVTLPTIQVRASVRTASAPQAAVPKPVAALTPVDSAAPAQTASRGGASLPTLRLDMPYYSFGKVLPRVGKE